MNTISQQFESGFLTQSLTEQVAHCDTYELAPLFKTLFKDNQPVLEAGCGSGRWCAWLGKQGIRSDGVDWSKALCARAAQEVPGSQFMACDMENTLLSSGAYGGVLALGSIEHAEHGPIPALREFHRILRPGGVAIITVPYGGPLRLFLSTLRAPKNRAKAIRVVRRLFGKSSTSGRSYRQARRPTHPEWHPEFSHGPEGWAFYEYRFNRGQMVDFIEAAGFLLDRQWVGFQDEGILHNFGCLAGRWNPQRASVTFTLAGRILRRLLPVEWTGHMLCQVVRKGGSTVP